MLMLVQVLMIVIVPIILQNVAKLWITFSPKIYNINLDILFFQGLIHLRQFCFIITHRISNQINIHFLISMGQTIS